MQYIIPNMTESLGAPPIGEEIEMSVTIIPLEDGGIEILKIGDVIIPTEDDLDEMEGEELPEGAEPEVEARPETMEEMIKRSFA